MAMKKCNRCGKNLDISMFYDCKSMKDGRLNTCKECVNKRVNKHREENIDRVMEYDRNRPNAKQRTENNKKRTLALKESDPDKYRKQVLIPKSKYRTNNHEKAIARSRVADAIISGKLKNPGICKHCGLDRKTEAHHQDYSKPLNVIWLCDYCHKEEHKRIREEERRIKCQKDHA